MSSSTRRQFLGSVAVGIAAASRVASGSETDSTANTPDVPDDEAANQVAILNDSHIGEDHAPGHVHPENLRAAVKQLCTLPERPAAVIINGDLAMSVGTPGDYRSFASLIEPLREAGLPVHLTLGNHDTRTEFLRAFADVPSATQFKNHRHNGVVDLPHARLVLLDSLKETPAAPGRLGDEQIAWLLEQIDAQTQKPVVLVAHHNPRIGGDPAHFPGGVVDTDAFWPELVKRPQLKGYIHGHVHDWTLGMDSGIHIINTLASAMVADKAVSTNGWTMATFYREGVALKVHTYLPDHPWSGERKWLYWRQPKQKG